MWHEARKHEKKIRGIMIDHRRRAERRREFYESIRRDPASYLQIHGQQMKIYIDPAISQAAESSLVPWMGDQNNMIDRFDVRANLDYIPTSVDVTTGENDNALTNDQECQLNYERFRNLIQNDFLDNNEQKVLHKIFLKERWGQQNNNVKTKNELKKKLAEKKAAIGYNYNETENKPSGNDESASDSADSDEEEEFEDLDTIVYTDQLEPEMCQRLNAVAKKYGVKSGLFMKFMQSDKAEADRLRIAKELENEKSMFVGRKSRRERKVLIQQRLLILRSINTEDCGVDHFGSEVSEKQIKSKSSSESSSSEDDDDDDDSKSEVEEGKIEFITSFGNDEDDVGEESNKNFKKKIKKLDKKRLKESKTKSAKAEKLKQIKQANEPLMYGPSLPSNTSSKDSKEFNSNIRFNSTNNSQIKNRRYRFRESDEEKSFNRSPSRPVRRSPSVRRRYSSEEEDSSDDSLIRSRSKNRSPIYRRRYSPPYRYRRSRSKDRRRNRDRSRSRSNRRSPIHRKQYRYSKSRSRSRSRKKSIERHRSRDRKSSYKSSSRGYKERHVDSNFGSDSKKQDVSKKENIKFDDSNLKLYKLLEKIEKNNKISKTKVPETKSEELETKNGKEQIEESEMTLKKEKSPPIKRYYRHDLVESGSGPSDDDEDDEENTKFPKSDKSLPNISSTLNTELNQTTKLISSMANLTASSVRASASIITPQERLKRLMQAQLDKQYKLDKKAEIDRLERQKMEQMERREFSKMSRYRERRTSRSRSSSYSSSYSNSSYQRRRKKYSRSISRSRSKSRGKHYRRSRSRSFSRERSSYYQRRGRSSSRSS